MKHIVRLNYLGYYLSEEELYRFKQCKSQNKNLNGVEGWLESFFEIDPCSLTPKVFERYNEVVNAGTYISTTHADPTLTNKLYGPIRSARRCYCFGEYLGAIELSAMYCEMLACFALKYAGDGYVEDVDGLPQTGKGDKGRINKLLSRKIITQDQYDIFLDVHKTRKKYFHWWTTSLDNVQPDACRSVNALSKLTKAMLLELKDGRDGLKLWVSNSIRKFFESKAKPLV